ncbi:hypothetical protein NG799_26875 [Laspinema sp. D1]|uniref:Uncharacterized protein n=1 Tax=Laspinema palackyanum D2a TaxID=2953684 RepID=A0ABT2MYW9_9CYAN|nr:hypothetical protein [Laspinema sp. D2a]
MSSELISTLKALSRSDQFYIMPILLSELAQQETSLIQSEQSYPVWSPYGANEAADTLLKVLQESQSQAV